MAAALLSVALLGLTACGQIYPSREPAAGPPNGIKANVQDVTIGFAQQQLQAAYFSAMAVQAEQIAQEQGFKLLFQSANKDPVIQMSQMQAMIAQGADALVVNATSVKGQTEMMTQIASQIPVIYIDTSVPGTGTTSVQSDNSTIGELSGMITAKRFLDMGKPSIKMVDPHRPGDRRVRRPGPARGIPLRAGQGRAEVRDRVRAARRLPAGQGPGGGGEHARRQPGHRPDHGTERLDGRSAPTAW